MSTPPRRRRTENKRAKPPAGGGWLPTIAMGLGVIVAGLGIGALVAVLMQRPAAGPAPVAAITTSSAPSEPVAAPRATRGPVAIATIAPPRTPRPSPSPVPSVSPSAASSAGPSVAPSAMAVLTAGRTAAPTTEPTTEPTAEPTVVAPAAAASVARISLVTPAATAVPSALATAAPAGASAESSRYDEHASAVVRRYVDALVRGDEKTAYAALGGSVGTASGTLSEQAFLDSGARIVSLKVTRIDASNASVGCEISSAKGRYYATYHVSAGSSGPYISEHDYIKV